MKKYFFILFLAFVACDSDAPITVISEIQSTCIDDLFTVDAGVSPPVAINVRNAVTDETIPATVMARDDAFDFEEILTPSVFEIPDNVELHTGLEGRAGSYIFTIEADGFQTFVTTPIFINENTCNGTTTPLILVRLFPN